MYQHTQKRKAYSRLCVVDSDGGGGGKNSNVVYRSPSSSVS